MNRTKRVGLILLIVLIVSTFFTSIVIEANNMKDDVVSKDNDPDMENLNNYKNLDNSNINKSDKKALLLIENIEDNKEDFIKNSDIILKNLKKTDDINSRIYKMYREDYMMNLDRYERFLTDMNIVVYQDSSLSEEELDKLSNTIKKAKEATKEVNKEFEEIEKDKNFKSTIVCLSAIFVICIIIFFLI